MVSRQLGGEFPAAQARFLLADCNPLHRDCWALPAAVRLGSGPVLSVVPRLQGPTTTQNTERTAPRRKQGQPDSR
jgi:hypothetical protein